MAEKQEAFQFKNVQLLGKDQPLGVGSYGAVYKAKCDDLICAAKIIHPTLFDPTALHLITPQKEHTLPIKRFEQECEFMSAIRHPNIVQYLGMFRDTADTHLPVLLMELMDDSLTHFLESSAQPIPYHIQVNICYDITLALSFLHSNNIVHRDLSSNNVLLRGNVLAKVTDFGMARLGDINPQATRFTNTMCPGTDVYMPPEAVQDKPMYTEKIDCFSFGVIIVQIFTRQFPKPGDRLQEVELNHPGLPRGKLLVQIPEIDRRQNHISQIDPNHSFLPIALDCLKDEENKRPSAHQLCERVASLKEIPSYIESARTVQDKDEIIRSQAIRVEDNKRTISLKEEEIRQLRQQLQQERGRASRQLEEHEKRLNQLLRQQQREKEQTNKQLIQNQQLRRVQQGNDLALREKTRQLQERETELGHVNQQLEASEHVLAQFKRQNAKLEQQLSQREQQNQKPSSRGQELTRFKLRWREGKRAPCVMERWCDAVVDDNTVYVRSGYTVKIYSYNTSSDSWSQLPDCVHNGGSIAIVNRWLTTIGGSRRLSTYSSNELFTLTGKGSDRRWTKKFPPMPTKRQRTTALCTGTTLIVAGGWGLDCKALPTVEVMNTENHQWSTAAHLPEPLFLASATVCGDQICVQGGVNEKNNYTKSVYTCSVSLLLLSCSQNSQVDKASTWRQLADLPVKRSICQSLHSRLLAIGGITDSREATKAVYMYNSAANSWEIISHMKAARYDCFTAVLPDNQLMVVGGFMTLDTGENTIDKVEFASV